jgi:biotin operon repressor
MEYQWNATILTWTKDKKILSLLKNITRELKLNLYKADKEEDLYGVPHFFSVVDGDKIKKVLLMNFKEMIAYENKKESGILVIGEVQSNIPVSIKRFFIQTKEGITSDYLKATILNKKYAISRHTKNKRTYDKTVFRIVYVLKKLMHPKELVRIEELCQAFNVSEKTIKRDIAMLRNMGEEIVFDKKRNGYTLISYE